MARGSWRNKLVEEKLIDRIDRGRNQGPKGDMYAEGVKKRLHECNQGEWVRQIMPGAGNFGPLLRVIDPKAGILENRQGMRVKVPPRTQVEVRQ